MVTSVRRSLEETWQYLESEGEEMPRDTNGQPFVPAQMPCHDDDAEPLGYSYFKEGHEDLDNSDLTLPRMFIGRSELERVKFVNTDLSESRMCWNDFDQCDFSQADLSRCDLRASLFRSCQFVSALLRGADLRRSTFVDSDFSGADLTGAVAETGDANDSLWSRLTEDQRAVVIWHPDAGPEPPGG